MIYFLYFFQKIASELDYEFNKSAFLCILRISYE